MSKFYIEPRKSFAHGTTWFSGPREVKPMATCINDAKEKGNNFIVASDIAIEKKNKIKQTKAYASYPSYKEYIKIMDGYTFPIYEIIKEDVECRFFADLEWELHWNSMKTIRLMIIELINIQFQKMNIEFNKNLLLFADACNMEQNKGSYHVHCPKLKFKNIIEQKRFWMAIEKNLNKEKHFFKSEDNKEKCFIDFGVYNKNRQFRAICSSKMKNGELQRPLLKEENVMNPYEDYFITVIDGSEREIDCSSLPEVIKKKLIKSNIIPNDTLPLHDKKEEVQTSFECNENDISLLLQMIPIIYDKWFKSGCALQKWGEVNLKKQLAFKLWDEWSQTYKVDGETMYDPVYVKNQWDSMEEYKDAYTIGTVCYFAKKSNEEKYEEWVKSKLPLQPTRRLLPPISYKGHEYTSENDEQNKYLIENIFKKHSGNAEIIKELWKGKIICTKLEKHDSDIYWWSVDKKLWIKNGEYRPKIREELIKLIENQIKFLYKNNDDDNKKDDTESENENTVNEYESEDLELNEKLEFKEENLQKLTVNELKEILKNKKLSRTGNKKNLIQRILNPEKVESTSKGKKTEDLPKSKQKIKILYTVLNEIYKEHYLTSVINELKSLIYSKDEAVNFLRFKINKDPFTLPLLNGKIIDFKKNGEIRDRTINDFWSFECPVHHLGNSDNPKVIKLVSSITGDDNIGKLQFEVIKCLFGSYLVGNGSGKNVDTFFGPQNNGKTTLVSIIAGILTENLAKCVGHGCLTTSANSSRNPKGDNECSPSIAAIEDMRYIYCDETSKTDRFHGLHIRSIFNGSANTGTPCRDPHERKQRTIYPKCKGSICTNFELGIDQEEEGTVSRFRWLIFRYIFVDDPQNPPSFAKGHKPEVLRQKDEKLVEEISTIYLSDIFAFFAEGAVEFVNNGCKVIFPKEILEMKREFWKIRIMSLDF